MKKSILQMYACIGFLITIASCTVPYHTKNLKSFNKSHNYVRHNVSPRERGDYNDKSVRQQTRKTLYGN
jgi:hypothetical protein